MRNLLLATLLVFSGCQNNQPVNELEPALFPDGFQFSTPCPECGSHLQTIDRSEMVRVYTITSDTGETVMVPESDLIIVFGQLGLVVPTKGE